VKSQEWPTEIKARPVAKFGEGRVMSRPLLRDVFNFYITPFLFEVFSDKAAVTIVRFFFAAKQTAIVEQLSRGLVLNATRPHQVEKLSLVEVPIAFLFLIAVENVLRWGQMRKVHVVDVADDPRKVPEIILLGETR